MDSKNSSRPSTRRVKCVANIGEILLIGEQLRVRMHTDKPNLVKDCRRQFRTHQCCFIGSEAVDWLLDTGQVPDLELGVHLFNILLEHHIIHSVNSECGFKYDNCLYRFCKDDGSFRWHEDISIFLKAEKTYQRMKVDKRCDVLGTHVDNKHSYYESFYGSEFVKWLIASGELSTVEEALQYGRTLLENDILKHVSDEYHFQATENLYQFKFDFSRRHELVDLIYSSPHRRRLMSSPFNTQKNCDNNSRSGATSPFISPTRTKNSYSKNIPMPSPVYNAHKSESGYQSSSTQGSSPGSVTAGSPHFTAADCGENETMSSSRNTHKRYSSSSNGCVPNLLMIKATVKDLERTDTSYIKKHIRVTSDPVGFGFVIRGEGPVYIKTCDPGGPAAAAGLKVGHYIYKMYDQNVLRMTHKDMAQIIAGKPYINMVVMEHKQPTDIDL